VYILIKNSGVGGDSEVKEDNILIKKSGVVLVMVVVYREKPALQ
jgi:hypothetical protein